MVHPKQNSVNDPLKVEENSPNKDPKWEEEEEEGAQVKNMIDSSPTRNKALQKTNKEVLLTNPVLIIQDGR